MSAIISGSVTLSRSVMHYRHASLRRLENAPIVIFSPVWQIHVFMVATTICAIKRNIGVQCLSPDDCTSGFCFGYRFTGGIPIGDVTCGDDGSSIGTADPSGRAPAAHPADQPPW